MCKEERTIKVLKNYEQRLQEQGWDTKHFEIAYDALEKQIPKVVDKENGFYFCPICSKGGNSWDRQNYCQYCGQALRS